MPPDLSVAAVVVGAVLSAALVIGALYLLRRAFRAVRAFIEIGRGIQESQRDLRTATDEIRKAVQLAAFYDRPVVREHLAVLGGAAAATAGEAAVSLRLVRVAARIFPTFAREVAGDLSTVVCTVAIGDGYRARVKACLDSQQAYALRHGFSYCVLENPNPLQDRPPSWMKIPLIHKLLAQGYRRVLYLDADAMVTNMDVAVDALFSQLENADRAVLMTEDEGGVNAGILFVHSCDAAFRLLDLVWHNDADVHHPTWEQHALRGLMDASNAVRATVLIEPDPKLFNSFPVERRGLYSTRPHQIWSPGDFICHFCALQGPDLDRCIARYADAIASGALDTLKSGAPAELPRPIGTAAGVPAAE
ncbi:MAG: hypothetical protein ACLP1D_18640 [Xanthobacteraceae bacterium]